MTMTIDDIKTLIASDESRILELKKSTGELKDGMHSACAFLNTEGGWLIFGVAPKSLKIIGQEVSDNTQRELAQALAGLDPVVDVYVNYVMCLITLVIRSLLCTLTDGYGVNDHILSMAVLITRSKALLKLCHMRCMMNASVRINLRCIRGKVNLRRALL